MPELFILPNADAAKYYTTTALNGDNAGFDVYVPTKLLFEPGEKKLVNMGVRAVLVDGDAFKHYWMLPRSSISKTGLMMLNSVGVIDKTYRGELMGAVWSYNDTVQIQKGTRLFQVLAPDMGWIKEVRIVESLSNTVRGEGGFGSTGLTGI
jgi:dUTP pyrophosphatase